MSRNLLIRILAILLLAGPADRVAAASDRVALVIGNGAYRSAPPAKQAVAGAHAMAAALRAIGFDVLAGTDLDLAATTRMVASFRTNASLARVAVVYFAGRAVSVDGRTCLVAVDARSRTAAELATGAVPLETVIAGLPRDRLRAVIAFVDASRDRSVERGPNPAAHPSPPAVSESEPGLVVAYATGSGRGLVETDGEYSPYTEALLDHIGTPGVTLHEVLARVGKSVAKRTGVRQLPWFGSSLHGDFCLNEGR